MTLKIKHPLLIGEIIVDVTVTPRGEENKMRLGGIAHAARGFWALGVPFAAAVIVPEYLEKSAKHFFSHLGCIDFQILGYVRGSPNVALIFDPTEVDDQEYDFLLRDEKEIDLSIAPNKGVFSKYRDILIFPGTYDLGVVCKLMPKEARLHIDVAYNIQTVDELNELNASLTTVFISTSSPLFMAIGTSGINQLATQFAPLELEVIILKENRGGSRLHIYASGETERLPAHLGETANSVGVGDVYDTVYLAFRENGLVEAAWRAASISSAYAQTTEPDLFQEYVRRELKLSLTTLRELGGSTLSWEDRPAKQIYLAAPDFQDANTSVIERAISSLEYHNFKVRRPIKENGELPPESDEATLGITYQKDVELLKQCQLMFAIPTGRDPGTLVEIGLAIQMSIPVVVYDPAAECSNTMVIGGSEQYSQNLDLCLSAVFTALSKKAEANG